MIYQLNYLALDTSCSTKYFKTLKGISNFIKRHNDICFYRIFNINTKEEIFLNFFESE